MKDQEELEASVLRDKIPIFNIVLFLIMSVIIFYPINSSINKLNNDIKESRHREELLYQECKNLDYEISVLTTQYTQEKLPQ